MTDDLAASATRRNPGSAARRPSAARDTPRREARSVAASAPSRAAPADSPRGRSLPPPAAADRYRSAGRRVAIAAPSNFPLPPARPIAASPPPCPSSARDAGRRGRIARCGLGFGRKRQAGGLGRHRRALRLRGLQGNGSSPGVSVPCLTADVTRRRPFFSKCRPNGEKPLQISSPATESQGEGRRGDGLANDGQPADANG